MTDIPYSDKSQGDNVTVVIVDEDLNTIKVLRGDDLGLFGPYVQMLRYNTSTLKWERWDGKMDTVVSGDLIVAVDDLEQYILDKLDQYNLANYEIAGSIVYIGKLDKDGKYILKRVNMSTGVVDYSAGSSGYSAAWTNRASETYQSFDTVF